MSQKYQKLKTLLRELFQLDQPDLDFGIYRILHARSAEIGQFLDQDLLPQVREILAQHESAEAADARAKLQQRIDLRRQLGDDPEQDAEVQRLRALIAAAGVPREQLEAEVYDHLYGFFRRYYSEGDFLSKRVYKPGVYAIPYEGEEVKLHWANADQYYIKTSEYLRDYAFRLRPDDARDPMRVHFRLVDAAEGEHGNIKEAQGKERRFKLASEPSITEEDGDLVIRFTYQPDAAKQKELNADAEAMILTRLTGTQDRWANALRMPHLRSDGSEAGTRLRVHLDRYSARNTFDYFIHKDLGGFLRRELDFYIKNEVMHLDDIESQTAPRVEQYLSKIKVIRRIAGKVIDFLAQLEDFQRELWLKKRFVVESSYRIRLGCIPEQFYSEIASSDRQRREWVDLFALDEIAEDVVTRGYSVPLTVEFLRSNPALVVNTRNFRREFVGRLLEAIDGLDGQIDGVLVNSENAQALNLMAARFNGEVGCVFIDPPYNTGNDGFAYKDDYQHSTWLTMIAERLGLARPLMMDGATLWCVLDVNESPRLWQVGNLTFGEKCFVGEVVWQHSVQTKGYAGRLALSHNNIFCWAKSSVATIGTLDRTDENNKSYSNPDGDPKGPWRTGYLVNSLVRPNLRFPVTSPSGHVIQPPRNGWRYSEATMKAKISSGEIYFSQDESRLIRKIYLLDQDGHVPNSLWLAKDAGSSRSGNLELKALLPAALFSTSKPISLLQRVISIADSSDLLVLDFFAGSGSTGHAVIDLNRADGERRKFLLVEVGEHFDNVLVPRIMKASYARGWAGGVPERLASAEDVDRGPRVIKVLRLESYEDTLNNLDLRRTERQASLLELPDAGGPDGLKEQYLLRYMLDVESRGSASLLNVRAFTDPTAYKLKVKRPGSDESREVNVDLIETFNWLIGLTVQHYAAPRVFSAEFVRDSEGRLTLQDRLKPDVTGPYWLRPVTGMLPDGRKVLVVWRRLTGDLERDNLVLDTWFAKQGYSSKDSEFDLIYVNGSCNLENLKTPDDHWKVRLIEEDFHRLMFAEDAP